MELVPSFGKSLFENLSDPIIDSLELGIDSMFDNPLLAELPVVKYFFATGKTIVAIRDKLFLRKTLKFLSDFQHKTVDQEELDKRKNALDKKEKWIIDEIEFLILTIERTDREEKAKVISELYKEYLNGQLTKYNFEDYCSITERLFLLDILQLRADYDYVLEEERNENPPTGNYVYGKTSYTEQLGRLLALGLLTISAKTHPKMTTSEDLLEYKLSARGRKYCEILSRLDFLGMSSQIFSSK